MAIDLWVEKYRPKTVDEYVFIDDNMKHKVKTFVLNNCIDSHLLLSGNPGCGKTSLAKMLFKELKVSDGDILEINASEERGIDIIREKILNFCRNYPFGEYRYILLDESDSLTPDAQKALRNVLEEYSSTSRFIFTANYRNKIIPALHSRLQEFVFTKLDRDDFLIRCGEILTKEKIEFDFETLSDYVTATYPDMRKCINLFQQNSSTGVLLSAKNASTTDDYMLAMIDLFKEGRISDARKLIVSQASPEQYDEIYRFFYENLQYWGETDNQQDNAILVISEALKGHTLVSDPEINLAACLIQLNRIRNDS